MFRVEKLDGEGAAAYEAALLERAAWLDERGLGMWKAEHLTIAGITARYTQVAEGDPCYQLPNSQRAAARYPHPEFYGAFDGPELAGGFVLLEADPRYWPDSAGDEAFYFHKFVVRPRFAGRGCADLMLDWVEDFAARSGKDFVRLDYDGSRPYLRAMYLRHGFEDAGTATTSEGRVLILGELRTAAEA